MIIYNVKGTHTKRAFIKGDLEYEVVDTPTYTYTSRKEANEKLSELNRDALRRGWKTKINLVGRGDKESALIVFTGDTWVHENSGETISENYYYVVTKDNRTPKRRRK